jgi:hypothetical protein
MSSITNVQGVSSSATLAAAAKVAPPNPKPSEAKSQPPASDTVQLSSAAQSALQKAKETPAQEAIETPNQTAQEALAGDAQAKRVLAQQAATQRLQAGSTQTPKS